MACKIIYCTTNHIFLLTLFRFKWVELQIGVFFPKKRSGMTANDIKEKVQKLQRMTGEPQLDKVYAQIMERNTSGSEARKVAMRVYKWLLHSQLPLSAKV